MRIRFKLSDADRQKYGGDEWVLFDSAKLTALGYDKLAELEQDIKADRTSISQIIALEWPRITVLGVRGMVWLARQLNGFDKPAWPDFKPDIIDIDFESVAGDADPPTGGSSEPPSEPTPKARTARSKKG